MKYEELVIINRRIGNKLESIANRTANMAIVGSADSSNPHFVELMREQERLLKKSEEIVGEMERALDE